MKSHFFSYIFFSLLFSCSSYPDSKAQESRYFVRPIESVCDYSFNDTTKWVITCRVWGVLKYYHPNVTAGILDWDKVLLDRLEDINRSTTPEMLNVALLKMIDAAGKYTEKKDNNWNDSLNMNLNLCWLENSFLDNGLREKLMKVASLSVEYPSRYGLNFNSDKQMWAQSEKLYKDVDIFSSYDYRLLALFRYWNVIYYFFPHKYLMDKSWDKTLGDSVFPFINASDRQSYKIAFLKLAAALNDSHAFVNISDPFLTSHDLVGFVEGKTVVKTDRSRLKKGDIIVTVGNRDVISIRDSLSTLVAASTPGRKEYLINWHIAEMVFTHETTVSVLRNTQKLIIDLLPVVIEKQQVLSHKKLSDEIGYVDLSQLKTEEIESLFQSFANTKSVIFDLRKQGPFKFDVRLLDCHLSDRDSLFSTLGIFGDWIHPGSFVWLNFPQIPNSKCNRYKGRIVFLVDESVQSFAETRAKVARYNYSATLVGRSTSGAWGQVAWVPLPGGFVAAFSSVGLFLPDGTELQRRGIIPDIEVYPTMKDVLEGRDEILDATVTYLNYKRD